MLLSDLVDTSQAVGATRSRSAKKALIADALRRADVDEVETVVTYLSGELRQRRTGIGWRSLQSLPSPAAEPGLSVADVHDAFQHLSTLAGPGSQTARQQGGPSCSPGRPPTSSRSWPGWSAASSGRVRSTA